MLEPFTVAGDASINVAMNLMVENNVGSLVVVKDNMPIGIITERDIIKIASSSTGKSPTKVEEIMSTPVITISEDSSLWDAFRLMLEKKIRRLPVEKNGKLTGLVSERDLFRWAMLVVQERTIPEDIKNYVMKNVNPEK
jgi:CBS domain-containing protein